LEVVHGGLLGDKGPGFLDAMIRHFLGVLEEGAADVVAFNYVPVDSEIARAVQDRVRGLQLGRPLAPNPHWEMTLPGAMEDFYQGLSRKHRYNLRRNARLFEEETGGEAEVRSFLGGEGFERFWPLAMEVYGKTYQQGLGVLGDLALRRRQYGSLARLGRLSMHLLLGKGEARAFQIGVPYGTVYHLMALSYDPDWSRFSPGSVLFVRVLEELVQSGSFRRIDFGLGDAWYKSSYGTRRWDEVTLLLLSRRWKAKCFSLVSGGCAWITAKGKALLYGSGRLQRIERASAAKSAGLPIRFVAAES